MVVLHFDGMMMVVWVVVGLAGAVCLVGAEGRTGRKGVAGCWRLWAIHPGAPSRTRAMRDEMVAEDGDE